MEMEEALREELEAVDAQIALAEETQGDLEVRDGLAAKAEIYRRRGDRPNARLYYSKALEKTSGAAKKLDFQIAILHTYFEEGDDDRFAEQLGVCQQLSGEGGDWEKRNKLSVYEGVLALRRRELTRAATLFLGCISTFNAAEIVSFEAAASYAVLFGMLTLPRRELNEKIVENADVRAVLNELPALNTLFFAHYHSDYAAYFPALLAAVDAVVRPDALLRPLERLLLGRARLAVYRQYLEAYRTVRLATMAADFGVSPAFLDRELAALIAAGRLGCRINLPTGTVEPAPRDERAALTAELFARSDALAERLSQIIAVAQR